MSVADQLIAVRLQEASYHQRIARRLRKELELEGRPTGRVKEYEPKPGPPREVTAGRQMSHRLFVGCPHCDKDVPLGRYVQHAETTHKDTHRSWHQQWVQRHEQNPDAPLNVPLMGRYEPILRSGHSRYLDHAVRVAAHEKWGGSFKSQRFPRDAEGQTTVPILRPDGSTQRLVVTLRKSSPKATTISTRPLGGRKTIEKKYLTQAIGNCGEVAAKLAAKHGADVPVQRDLQRDYSEILNQHKRRLQAVHDIEDAARMGSDQLASHLRLLRNHINGHLATTDRAFESKRSSPVDEIWRAHRRGVAEAKMFGNDEKEAGARAAFAAAHRLAVEAGRARKHPGHNIVVMSKVQRIPADRLRLGYPLEPGSRGDMIHAFHVYYEHPEHGGLNYGAHQRAGDMQVIGRVPLPNAKKRVKITHETHGCYQCGALPGAPHDEVEHAWRRSRNT